MELIFFSCSRKEISVLEISTLLWDVLEFISRLRMKRSNSFAGSTTSRSGSNICRRWIEEKYFEECPEFKAESDKAWDAMHRTLADGQLTWDGGEYPLNHVVLGGEPLYTEDDYIISLKTPDQVRAVAAALPGITEAEFQGRYRAMDPESYRMELSNEDFEYTWSWFQKVRDLYQLAAKEGRFVLFTADQ